MQNKTWKDKQLKTWNWDRGSLNLNTDVHSHSAGNLTKLGLLHFAPKTQCQDKKHVHSWWKQKAEEDL